MKRSARQYAAALLAAVAAGVEPAAAVRNLRIMLRRAHATRLLPRILRSAVVLQSAQDDTTLVSITLAQQQNVHDLRGMVEKQVGKSSLKLDERPELGGGAIVRAGDRQVDGSVKLMLNRLKHGLAGTASFPQQDNKGSQ